MQNPVRSLARPMLASVFVIGGVEQLQNSDATVPAPKDSYARGTTPAASVRLEQRTVVQITGAAQIAGGLALALGKAPRTASAVLAATLIPTTLASQRFWEADTPEARREQQAGLVRNVALMGGLLLATQDTQGQPGVAWSAQHGVEHAAIKASEVAAKAAKAKSETELVAQTARANVAATVARGAVNAAALAAGTAVRLFGKRASKDVRRQAKRASKAASHRAEVAGAKSQALRAKVVPDVIDLAEKAVSMATG